MFIPFQPPSLHNFYIYVDDTKIIDSLTSKYPSVGILDKAIDKFSTFDFWNEHYLVEVKSRRKKYDPWLIEKHKVDSNMSLASGTDQQVLYVTEHQGIAYVWNISKMVDANYDFKWTQKNMPQTTDFSNNRWVKKHVGYVSESDAKIFTL